MFRYSLLPFVLLRTSIGLSALICNIVVECRSPAISFV